MKKTWFLFCFVLLFTFIKAQQADSFPAAAKYGFADKIISAGKISCFTDPGKNSDISQITGNDFSVPYSSFLQKLNSNPLAYTFWLKFSLQNNTDSALKCYLYFGSLNYIDVYFIAADNSQQHLKAGNLVAAKNMASYRGNSLSVPLVLAPHEHNKVFVKIVQKTQEYDFEGINIFSENNYYKALLNDHESSRGFIIFQLLFQGLLISQILYVIFQWAIIRRKEYLYYVLYLIVVSIYFLSKYENDIGIHFLFSRYPVLAIYLNKTLILLPYFLYFRFVRSFLDMEHNYPRLTKWLKGLEYFLLAYVIFDLIFIVTTFNLAIQGALYTFILITVFIIVLTFMIYLFTQKKIIIYYIISGSLFVGLGNITGLVLTYLDYDLHYNTGIADKLIFSQIGIVLEIFCFTAGLGYKNKAAEKEKINSQKKLIEQMKVNEALESNMQNIRNKIAQDLHDDIGSTLSSISILSDLALKNNNSRQSEEMMNEIKESSITLMEKMDDIVWSINTRNDSIENMMLRIKHFAATLFEAKEIDYEINIEENINELKLPMEYRQNIYLIMKETINNLVKHSRANKASIKVYVTNNFLQVEITDNGKGFDAQQMFSGNGIISMKSRAASINATLGFNSAGSNGSSVLLSLKIK